LKIPIKTLARRLADGYLHAGFENDFQSPIQIRAMIVCLCKGVSSRVILDEVRRGNCSVKGIAQACQAGRDCGSCVSQIREMIGAAGGSARSHDDTKPPGR
jgi:bacterioferritin-associated ferredoxin